MLQQLSGMQGVHASVGPGQLGLAGSVLAHVLRQGRLARQPLAISPHGLSLPLIPDYGMPMCCASEVEQDDTLLA